MQPAQDIRGSASHSYQEMALWAWVRVTAGWCRLYGLRAPSGEER